MSSTGGRFPAVTQRACRSGRSIRNSGPNSSRAPRSAAAGHARARLPPRRGGSRSVAARSSTRRRRGLTSSPSLALAAGSGRPRGPTRGPWRPRSCRLPPRLRAAAGGAASARGRWPSQARRPRCTGARRGAVRARRWMRASRGRMVDVEALMISNRMDSRYNRLSQLEAGDGAEDECRHRRSPARAGTPDVLGTSSIKETIDSALREVVRAEARRREIRALAVMDGLDLADEKVMTKAWRS